MKDFIIQSLSDQQTISVATIILNYIMAFVVAFFIMAVNKFTYTGTAFSKRFNVSLGAICIITTMIMSVITNNIALSLGMVGALSIIRFRTAVKDIRDATFIFWSIAVGIGCGVSQYILVGCGSIFLFLFLVLTKSTKSDNTRLLIIQGSLKSQNKIQAAVDTYFNSKAHQTIKNASKEDFEVIYSLNEKYLIKATEKNMVDIVEYLMNIEGTYRVNLVEQLDDISR